MTFTPGEGYEANYDIATKTVHVTVIDRDALTVLNKQATVVENEATVGVGNGQYTQGAKDIFENAIKAAGAVHGKTAADNTQEAVNDAKETLQDAINTFKSAENIVGVEGLKSLVQTATTTVTNATYGERNGDHALDKKTVLDDAITTGQAIILKKDRTPSDVDEAIADLQTAILTFESTLVRVNFTGLKTKLAEAKAIVRGNYTTATWDALQDAILSAEAIIDGHVTQNETNDMTEALTGAIAGLVNNNGGGSTGAGNTTNPTPPSQAIPGGVTVTAPAGIPTVNNSDGSVTLPGGGKVDSGGATVVVPEGSTIDKDGAVTVGEAGGNAAMPGGVTVSVPEGSIIDKDGNTTVGVSGGSVSIPSGVTVAVPGGSVVTPGESVSLPKESGGAITLGSGLTLNTPAGAEIVFDEDASLGYRVDADNPFSDVKPNNWFYADAMFAYGHGLLNGTGAAEYSPEMPTTRGMIVTILHRLESEPDAGTENIFSDVANGEYYAKAVTWAAEEGIVEGYGDAIFMPNLDITRQELAAVLLRFARHNELALPGVREYTAFADDTNISDYAREAVEALYKAGIISGKPGNVFDPKGTATRAEAAAILHRFLESAVK
jgi:hypothetical protein